MPRAANVLGEGSFGRVVRQVDSEGHCLAVKQFKYPRRDGITMETMAELALHWSLPHHRNVALMVKEVNFESATPQVFMDVADSNLDEYLRRLGGRHVQSDEASRLVSQIVRGVHHMHRHGFLHRDLSARNVLVYDNGGRIALTDFGSARRYIEKYAMWSGVCTIWYRAIELLLGEEYYDYAIDVWSVGMLLLHILNTSAVCRGDSDWGQLIAYFSLLGTPTESTWPDVVLLAHWQAEWPKMPCRELEPSADPVLNLVAQRALTYDPKLRATSAEILDLLDRSLAPPPPSPGAREASDHLRPRALTPLALDERLVHLDWLCETGYELSMSQDAIHKAARILDAFLHETSVPLRMVHTAAMLSISFKLHQELDEYGGYPMPEFMHRHCHSLFLETEFVDAEYEVLRAVGPMLWDSTALTPLVFRRLTWTERLVADLTLYLYPPVAPAEAAVACTSTSGAARATIEAWLRDDAVHLVGLFRAHRSMWELEMGCEAVE
jgi:serine/threonine protein kinase